MAYRIWGAALAAALMISGTGYWAAMVVDGMGLGMVTAIARQDAKASASRPVVVASSHRGLQSSRFRDHTVLWSGKVWRDGKRGCWRQCFDNFDECLSQENKTVCVSWVKTCLESCERVAGRPGKSEP